MKPRWDIFCKVVDNFGDIGVAWRLARGLVADHGKEVCLWVDDLGALTRIWPDVSPGQARQRVSGVDVRHWREPFPAADPGEVVIETFQCTLPQSYIVAMAARSRAPCWINLDYLSAETWVAGCHRLPSPHPRLRLTKYFYFPGFDAATGGLLREPGLEAQREAFLRDPQAVAKLWARLGLEAPREDEIRISLFCYPGAPVAELLHAWSAGPARVTALMPEGPAASRLLATLTETERACGVVERGAAVLKVVPFMSQDEYDRLLWAADINFARGEDSFVRAQWARHPFVWNIYPQGENAHWIKLHAFLDRYTGGLEAPPAEALRRLWRAWNGISRPSEMAQAWQAFAAHARTIERHARGWANSLESHHDLATGLVEFCADIGQSWVT